MINRKSTPVKTHDRSAWYRCAGDLAAWAMERLVNRQDAHGAYTRPEERGKDRQDGKGKVPTSYTSKKEVTVWKLARHYRGESHHHVMGLHSTSTDNRCLWGAFDIDRHADATDPAATLAFAMRLYRAVLSRGFRPLLTDSNGRGGYHQRILFRRPAPSRDLHHLLRMIAGEVGFKGEQFPKQANLSERTRFGNWLRLPGLHHTRPHFATVFDGKNWLAGAACVEWLLSFTGDSPALVPEAPPETPKAVRPFPPTWPRRPPGNGLAGRIRAYVDACPNLAEGEGRDDVAYRLAAFLVRDLGLPDHVALPWLERWDGGNSPPKGRDRLLEIVTNAHNYGRHGYGEGA